MSADSSSFVNASLPPPSSSETFNLNVLLNLCMKFRRAKISTIAYTVTNILLLLPLCILVIYLGLQLRLRRRRPGLAASHLDVFTYNMVVLELVNLVATVLFCWGSLVERLDVVAFGVGVSVINVTGQMYFHMLTCVERYLAVVHPITYLGLRTAKGIRIRNATILCVWLLSFANVFTVFAESNGFTFILSYCNLTAILLVTSFCSLSVLWVLTRPGPGQGGGGRWQVDQSKLRAFYITVVILGVLLLRFVVNLVGTVLYGLVYLSKEQTCVVFIVTPWFSLPSSLVLPLLFLHRAARLPAGAPSQDQPPN